MNGSQPKTSVIPKVAYVIAGIVLLCGYFVMRYAAIPSDPKSAGWPEGGKVLLSALVPLVGAAWVLLIGYIYGDSKRRLMRPWLWTLLAIFIPDAIGIILYFILRDPLPFYCSKCGASVNAKFTFCPSCATPLRPTCTQCGRGLERGWAHCPHCGVAAPAANQISPSTGTPAPGAS